MNILLTITASLLLLSVVVIIRLALLLKAKSAEIVMMQTLYTHDMCSNGCKAQSVQFEDYSCS